MYVMVYLPGGTARTEVLSGTKVLVQFLRGRNIILSRLGCLNMYYCIYTHSIIAVVPKPDLVLGNSGADSYLHLRGPHDAMNMGEILNLNRKQVSPPLQ